MVALSNALSLHVHTSVQGNGFFATYFFAYAFQQLANDIKKDRGNFLRQSCPRGHSQTLIVQTKYEISNYIGLEP